MHDEELDAEIEEFAEELRSVGQRLAGDLGIDVEEGLRRLHEAAARLDGPQA